MTNTKRLAAPAAAVAIGLVMTACAPTVTEGGSNGGATTTPEDVTAEVAYYTSAEEVVDAYDISEFCGDKEITVAWASPLNVTWLQTVEAILGQQLEQCPNVSLVATDGQGDPQKSNSDMNSLVAQGVDAIIANPIFGETQVPAMRDAFDAGRS